MIMISDALSPHGPSRRDVLIKGVAASVASVPSIGIALDDTITEKGVDLTASAKSKLQFEEPSIDMSKINAARASSTTSKTPPGIIKTARAIFPIDDPPPNLSIHNRPSSSLPIPRIGYSFYKTASDQAERCTAVALRSGIRHFDVASSYGSNPQIAKTLERYLNLGLEGLDFSNEKPEVLERIDAIRRAGEMHSQKTIGGGSNPALSPAPMGSTGRRGRREALFIHHKVSNSEQSTDPVAVRRAVKQTIGELKCSYLDMVSLHSPLTDMDRRLATYQSLLDLRDSGFIKSVGVCNYGVAPLQEIVAAGLDLPAVNQIELSPFNAHKGVVDWCDQNGVGISCGAWSRLSSADGPTEGWDVLSNLAQQKGMTKAQVLVRWSLQKGYICVPRSASASKVERLAIAENSYGGVNEKPPSFQLTSEEVRLLDSLDISYKAGKLGRRDGWTDSEVRGPDLGPNRLRMTMECCENWGFPYRGFRFLTF